ncbi:SPOR domain-containing protein [Devosia alba]|uniref:SPOR domain-containing protein n=1 Tax=Devosia alba TaxID=3152360 RepID=UPI003264E349
MAGKSEAADDLIAELAKLMAQDAQGDREANPSKPAPAQFVPVRIPGDAVPNAPGSAPTAFLRSLSASTGDASNPKTGEDIADTAARAPAEPIVAPAEPAPESAPFQFDFGIRGAASAVAAEDAPAAAAAPPAPPVSAPQGDEHDAIADLISAELSAEPAAVSPESTPRNVPQTPPAPAQPASAGPAVMATAVAAHNGAPYGESPASSRVDQDRFRVPPVFGLGSTPARPASGTPAAPAEPTLGLHQPAAPSVVVPTDSADDSPGTDPIDEIESLIGRAMRVEFDLPADAAPPAPASPEATTPKPASPALRSLATPTLPAGEASDGMSAADQTIFAAAHATGANLGWVNEPADQTEADLYPAAPRQRRGLGVSRALAGPLVAITLLLAAGFGLYWVLGLGSRDAGPAPLLTADTEPVKEVAPVAADESSAPQSIVFNEINGVTPGADEQLVSRDQSDVNEVTQEATAAVDLSDEGLANRKVRTVKVRPDGTIVSGDDGVAGSAILPVDRPNVPAVPGAATSAPELLADIAAVEPTPAATVAEPTVSPVEPGSTVPAVDQAGNLIAGKSAVVPLLRPAGLRLPSGSPAPAEGAVATDASVAPVVAATPSPTIPGATEVPALADSAPAYVQLASQRSEADARQSAQNMVTRYGPLFGGANLEVQRVDLGTKGIYYRVRVPANSLEEANMICTNVKAAGGDCFTL